MARGRRIVYDSSDDEFPDVRQIGTFQTKSSKDAPQSPVKQSEEPTNVASVRRRKLGPVTGNALLRPAIPKASSARTIFDDDDDVGRARSTRPQRIELRSRKSKPVTKSIEVEYLSEAESVQEETIIEDFSVDEESDFEASGSSGSEGNDSTAGLFLERSPPRAFKKPRGEPRTSKASGARRRSPSPSSQLLAEATEAQGREDTQESSSSKGDKSRSTPVSKRGTTPTDIDTPFSELKIYDRQRPRSKDSSSSTDRPTTPKSPAPEPKYKGLASPSKKINRIPATPHHHNADTFWDQEFIDEWNDEHSPKKQLFPPSARQPAAPSPKKSPAKKAPSQAAAARAAKKAFEQSKHELADTFLRELDERITEGRISELSASTGGIRIDWSNRLNTTAGRANWRRESTKKRRENSEDGGAAAGAATTSTTYRHHASIELAEKVIDDEHRLLNVIAHEFCHLANFMISGVTNNPHGKEFKMWAARVTRAFGDSRGIEVTTKHNYDIDFKYVWECTACLLEFKRHSKSINTERHRCGACKGELRQTKPVPRAKKPGAQESEYQRFMKEQMRLIRQENPGCPQRDIMKIVASRWSQREREEDKGASKELSSASTPSLPAIFGGGREKAESVAKSLNPLALIDLT